MVREGGGPQLEKCNRAAGLVSGGLCSLCHLGTTQTDAAWVPGARHLRVAPPATPLQLHEGSTSGIAGRNAGPGSPAPQSLCILKLFS